MEIVLAIVSMVTPVYTIVWEGDPSVSSFFLLNIKPSWAPSASMALRMFSTFSGVSATISQSSTYRDVYPHCEIVGWIRKSKADAIFSQCAGDTERPNGARVS